MIHRTEHIDRLALLHKIEDFDAANPEHLKKLSDASINVIRLSNGMLLNSAPLEHHPYLSDINNEKVTGLMIGTFPPISYLCDSLNLPNLTNLNNRRIAPPDIPWFHGNYTSLWKYTPINTEPIKNAERAEQPELLRKALLEQGVIYSDIIKYCQRLINVKYTAEDKQLSNIILNNNALQFLLENNNINRLYFTNSSAFAGNNNLLNASGTYRLIERDAFGLFLKGAQDNGYTIEYSLPETNDWININEGHRSAIEIRNIKNTLCNKVYINIRLATRATVKDFEVCFAVSPAAVGRGMVRQNACVQAYRLINNTSVPDSPAALLRTVLQAFFDDNLQTLVAYNV